MVSAARWEGGGAAHSADRNEEAGMPEGPWFFCLKHNTVEPKDGCAERHRLGPYETREQAGRAVESVAEREEQLTAEDRAWEGD
jgi:hypothetical protein